jgi:hypothetical protein
MKKRVGGLQQEASRIRESTGSADMKKDAHSESNQGSNVEGSKGIEGVDSKRSKSSKKEHLPQVSARHKRHQTE